MELKMDMIWKMMKEMRMGRTWMMKQEIWMMKQEIWMMMEEAWMDIIVMKMAASTTLNSALSLCELSSSLSLRGIRSYAFVKSSNPYVNFTKYSSLFMY